MTRFELTSLIQERKTYLCVGLDTDYDRLPQHLFKKSDPIFEFNKKIIDATHDLCVAYKLNTAFYEAQGAKGWRSMEKTVNYIGDNHFKIADAKRGDIGNTSRMYAKAFFEKLPFDAVTVAPYMGEDSVKPFLDFKGKWVILLALTSNKGASDFQLENSLYEHVIQKAQTWGNPDNLMFVVGATHPEKLADIRALAQDYFFLVPGVGAQGGDAQQIIQNGSNAEGGLLINSSRDIIFASSGLDFAEKAREAASLMVNVKC